MATTCSRCSSSRRSKVGRAERPRSGRAPAPPRRDRPRPRARPARDMHGAGRVRRDRVDVQDKGDGPIDARLATRLKVDGERNLRAQRATRPSHSPTWLPLLIRWFHAGHYDCWPGRPRTVCTLMRSAGSRGAGPPRPPWTYTKLSLGVLLIRTRPRLGSGQGSARPGRTPPEEQGRQWECPIRTDNSNLARAWWSPVVSAMSHPQASAAPICIVTRNAGDGVDLH
jgi:hypothetical protein